MKEIIWIWGLAGGYLICFYITARKPRKKHRFVVFLISKQYKITNKMKIGELLLVALALTDNVTKQPVADAKFSNVKVTVEDPTILEVDPDADGTDEDVKGLAAGTTNVDVVADIDYTDSTGASLHLPAQTASATATVVANADGVTFGVTLNPIASA